MTVWSDVRSALDGLRLDAPEPAPRRLSRCTRRLIARTSDPVVRQAIETGSLSSLRVLVQSPTCERDARRALGVLDRSSLDRLRDVVVNAEDQLADDRLEPDRRPAPQPCLADPVVTPVSTHAPPARPAAALSSFGGPVRRT